MKLDGIHHITAITGDAQANVDFYVRVLGLRLVKKSVNQDDPTVYHLFYGDEEAQPGLDLTSSIPGAPLGRAGEGLMHRSCGGSAARGGGLRGARLADEGVETAREAERLRFRDPEGLRARAAAIFDVPAAPCSPSTRRSPPSMRSRASTARAPTGPTQSAAAFLLEQGMGFTARDYGPRRAASAARASTRTTRRRPARPARRG